MTAFEFTPDREDYPETPDERRRRHVFEALGAASVCWTNIDRAGVFESERAAAVGDALIASVTPDPSHDERRAHELAELAARLLGQRDLARECAVALEQELAAHPRELEPGRAYALTFREPIEAEAAEALQQQLAHEAELLGVRFVVVDGEVHGPVEARLLDDLKHATSSRDALARLLQAVHSRAPHPVRAAEEALELELVDYPNAPHAHDWHELTGVEYLGRPRVWRCSTCGTSTGSKP